jgi:serine/threonine protein kinase
MYLPKPWPRRSSVCLCVPCGKGFSVDRASNQTPPVGVESALPSSRDKATVRPLPGSRAAGEIPSPAKDLMLNSGTKLGQYGIVTLVGAGGMGEVYRATDTKLGRDVALKVLPPDVARDPERLARFQREARAIAALNHPHIVTIFSVEETDGVHFLTMELVEGQSLDRLISASGLPVEQIVEIANALADALAAAHEKGIVHRDLKPASVRKDMENWWKPEYVEHLIDGLRKAGLKIAGQNKTRPPKPRNKTKS